MIPVGYMAKKVVARPEWLSSENIADIYSVSNCASDAFADYIKFWKHNGYWFFDSPSVVEEVAASESIDLTGTTMFYYEMYEQQFDRFEREWSDVVPESSFATHVLVPNKKRLEGFDVVTYSGGTSPQCSPLSCNSLADEVEVNRHCLLSSFEAAKHLIESGLLEGCSPGPAGIVAVYTLP